MPFERAFRLSSLLLAATALAALLLAHSVPLWLASITGTLLILGLLRTLGFLDGGRTSRQAARGSGLWTLLMIGAFALFILDLLVISRELLPAGIHFLVMLMGIKLGSLEDRRDFRHLYAISLMAILAAAALTTDAWYIPIFVLYLLAAVWTLLLYHLTHDARAAAFPERQEHPETTVGITGRFFWLTNGIAVVTFALTLAIFFLLPRIGAGMLQKSRGEGLRTAGFSERVDLGTIGSVKQDPQVVMRVELPDIPAEKTDRLYLRGVAYDRYNGRSWSTSDHYRRHLAVLSDGTFVVHGTRRRTQAAVSVPIQQDIVLEALDTSVLFAAPFGEYVSGDLSGIESDSMAGLHLSFSTSSPVRYSVTSRQYEMVSNERTDAVLNYPRSILERYLQLPDLSEKVGQLSQEVTRQAVTPYDRTRAIQEHLLRAYRYSLDVETTTSLHPLEEFLFTRRTGYCEHYATAMVVMLRTVGIPARLVTGFLATEWNDFGGYFTVRQRDAHAWVEAYFPQSGWVTFDPTPASGTAPSRTSWDAFFRLSESLRLYWDRLVIRYSSRDQSAVIHGIREGSDAVRGHLSLWMATVTWFALKVISTLTQFAHVTSSSAVGILGMLATLSLLAILLMIGKPMWWVVSSRHLAQRRQLRITGLYGMMLQTAARQGFSKSPAATPVEFSGMIAREWAVAGAMVAGVTDLYCRGRFSGMALTAEEISKAEHLIRSLQQLARAAR